MEMDRTQPQWLPPVAPQPAPAPPPQRSGWNRFTTPIFFAILALLKWGKALLLLLPKAKLLTTSASMLVSVGAYALIWGWKFAVGFVALLFRHELARRQRARRGTRRARRADPRLARYRGAAADRGRDRRRLLARARVHRL